MSNYSVALTKSQLLRVYFRLTQSQVVGGRLAKVLSFSKRLLKVWNELGPGESEEIAAAIPADEVRNVVCTSEEMNAIADALYRLLNSDTIMATDGSYVPNSTGIKMEIMVDAKTISPELETHLLKRLAREVVEPFNPEVEEAEEVDAAEVGVG